jgi:hypothetical protein
MIPRPISDFFNVVIRSVLVGLIGMSLFNLHVVRDREQRYSNVVCPGSQAAVSMNVDKAIAGAGEVQAAKQGRQAVALVMS